MTESKRPWVFAFDMIAKAEDYPEFPAITFERYPSADEELTYSDIVLKGNKLVKAIRKMGISRGDAFCVVMRNHPEVVLTMYAASALGAILVPIDPRSKGEKLRYQIMDSNSKGVIFSAEFIDSIEEVLINLPEVKVIGCLYNSEFGVPVSSKHPVMEEILEGPEAPMIEGNSYATDDRFMIMYTSGTTGNPKGVHRRGERLKFASMAAELIWKYTPEDKLYTGLSLSHGNSQVVTLFPALYNKIPAVISRKFSKKRIWDICRTYGCTTFSLLGGMMTGIYSEPAKPDDWDNPVRLVLSAGTPRAIWKAFEKRFNVKIHEWYGAMEGGFAHNPPGVGPIGSFGKPLKGRMRMKVVREDDTECNPSEIGELICRNLIGETRVEYHGNKEASEAKTRGGWLRTGDICHRDEDGWFFFDYRKGGGLRRQGDFIIPDYVEGIIAEHPEVSDVCVYGVDAASGAPGESDLVAAIAPEKNDVVDIESIFNLCLSRLERNSVPNYIQVVKEIPKSASEKNLDRILREEFNPENENVYKLENHMSS